MSFVAKVTSFSLSYLAEAADLDVVFGGNPFGNVGIRWVFKDYNLLCAVG